MTHPTGGDVFRIGADTPTEVVTDYVIAVQDDPNRPAVYASGDLYTFYTTSRESDFNFNFFDFFLPVNGGPPPHYHPFEDETWHVIDGEFQFNLGNQGDLSIVVPEGTTVFGPIDRTHGYRNLDSTASISGITPGARTLSFTTPGSLDLFFEAAAVRVIDINEPIPPFTGATEQDFINLAKFNLRTGQGIIFPAIDYEPPEDTLDYILVLPADAEGEVVEEAKALAEVEGFQVWTTGQHEGIAQRPTFMGNFGIEYISLVSLEESGEKSSYNQFFLNPQTPDEIFVQANLMAQQVVEPTNSPATGVATIYVDEEGNIDYTLTITGLDVWQMESDGTPQTPNREGDDVTAIHIHSGARGINGEHIFNIFDLVKQDETELSVEKNEDGSTTISGTWNETEKEIPTSLIDFINNSGLPGEESEFYIQVHTQRNPQGEIRGQIVRSTDDFPAQIESENQEVLYVKEGELTLKIGDEVRLVKEDTYVYIAPGNPYSIANFGEETVEALAVTVIKEPEVSPEVGNIGDRLFPSPLTPRLAVPPQEIIFLSDEADFFDEPDSNRRAIYAGNGNDEVFAHRWDIVRGEAGADILDASDGLGGNILTGGDGNDQIFVNGKDRAFGLNGNDFIDASGGSGGNRLSGGKGNDLLLAGSNDQLVGGRGEDILNIGRGGNNLLYGGFGADQFRIVNGTLPDAVEVVYDEEQLELVLPEVLGISLPPLFDTQNTIVDFKLGVDKIAILGIPEIASSFDNLELLPVFGDTSSTSIIASFTDADGIEKDISLANVKGIIFNELSADDFIFS